MSENAWIEHDGGQMPVAGDVLVEIQLQHRDGEVRNRPGREPASWFESLNWWRGGTTFWRIIAYRLSGPSA
ncbi:hypothetical protein [Sphingomonas sp. SAFR-052]|uniref:hypothetical protein n=1 Tax=Sphingomonas sp. SAFR-052 TaxID=3436867 RepID=UPI003F8035C9